MRLLFLSKGISIKTFYIKIEQKMKIIHKMNEEKSLKRMQSCKDTTQCSVGSVVPS